MSINFSFLESNERLDYCLQTKVIMKCEYVDKSMHISATQSLEQCHQIMFSLLAVLLKQTN